MIYWFATWWVFTGLLGGGLAYRLGMLAAQDRGTLLTSGVNGAYALIVRRSMRKAALRFLMAMFAIFVGLIVFLQPSHGELNPVGAALSAVITLLTSVFTYATYADLIDRTRLVTREGVLRDANPGPAQPQRP